MNACPLCMQLHIKFYANLINSLNVYPLFELLVEEYSVDSPVLGNQCSHKQSITNVVLPQTDLYSIKKI